MAKVLGLTELAADRPGGKLIWAYAQAWAAKHVERWRQETDDGRIETDYAEGPPIVWVTRNPDESLHSVNIAYGEHARRRTFRIDPFDILYPPNDAS